MRFSTLSRREKWPASVAEPPDEPDQIAAWRAASMASIRIVIAELCAVLNHAREDGHITDNPAARLSKFYKQAKVLLAPCRSRPKRTLR